jgi:hypothetical protein
MSIGCYVSTARVCNASQSRCAFLVVSGIKRDDPLSSRFTRGEKAARFSAAVTQRKHEDRSDVTIYAFVFGQWVTVRIASVGPLN